MKVQLDTPVILAQDYEKMVTWYRESLQLDIREVVSEGYHFTQFEADGKSILGVADAQEMGVIPTEPRANTAIIQVVTSDIEELFLSVKNRSGRILFGPKTEESSGSKYGGFLDIEGNQIWASENKDI